MLFIELFRVVRRHAHLFLRDMRSFLTEYIYAKRHGIEYISGLYEDRSKGGFFDDAKEYEGSDFTRFNEVLDYLKITSDDVFVDIGCGKGKALFFAAMKQPRKVVGVELMPEYAEYARTIARRLSAQLRVPIEIHNADAAATRIDEGTIYYLFNPFGTDTLQAVLENIRAGLSANPRPIRIVYSFPRFEQVLEQCSWLERVHRFEGEGSCPGNTAMSVWQNVRQPQPAAIGPHEQTVSGMTN